MCVLQGIVEEEELPGILGQPLALKSEQALCLYVYQHHVFYMMTTRRALLKKFSGREKRERKRR
jgi:hypothetical protein